ncbi:MAG: gamma carbonic anhydrase family protein [Thermoanaerobaculia bacterium]
MLQSREVMIMRAYEGKEPRIGARVFLAETCALIGDVELAEDVSVWYGAVLRGDIHHIRIGARTNIQDNSVLHVEHETGPTIIGEQVTVGHMAVVHGCTVHRGALIGIGAKVLSHAIIGELALIAAGSVVQEGMEVPPRTLVAGVPARVKRELKPEELQRMDRGWRVYVDYKNEYLRAAGASL